MWWAGAWNKTSLLCISVPLLTSFTNHNIFCLLSAVALHSETMAKDMTLLWASGSPPCWRVMIMLEEKQLQGYNQKLLSFEKKEHKSQEVLDMNPRGQIPTFKCGKHILNESCAACLFLENQYKSQGTKLIPDFPDAQALMYQRMFEAVTLHQKIADLVVYKYFVPEGERHDSAVQRKIEALTAELKLWEGYLKITDCCLAGQEFTLADVLFFPLIAFLFHFGLSSERYPALAKYYNSLKDRPSIKATWPPYWQKIPEMDTMKPI
ncbi:glutathione S-transferase A-like [Acanthochromis polyacanthus]|uniref:glutathione S-transferase A-like n=1 Tax=Acanthochromis polyacanthus TaxID=80966 RepID=UPI00223415C3|nr:glutathione S-transferase A-like [Acanthochromis polyacanthus]